MKKIQSPAVPPTTSPVVGALPQFSRWRHVPRITEHGRYNLLSPSMYSPPQRTLLNLSTEMLIQILAYLPPVDLFSVRRTCRQIHDIVAGTTYLQYTLRTQINGVDDFLPPNVPYPERLALLRRHEKSWNGLQFNLFAEFTTSVPQPDCFTLRDGYLIYEDLSGPVLQYGYTDFCSASRNEELPWVHVTMGHIELPLPSKVVFAVDQDLMVAMREQDYDLYDTVQLELAFFEFTTGSPHPLSSMHTVALPPIVGFQFADVDTEVVGDHVLISVRLQTGQASFHLVSWKTGTVTLLCNLSDKWTPLWGGAPKLAVIDSDLIAVIKDSANSLEICKLKVAASTSPCLQTICFLELPPLASEASCVLSMAIREWVPTSKHHARSSSSRKKHHVPFYSSTVGTIALSLDYRTYSKGAGYPFRCMMVISIAAILSTIRSDVRNVPWKDWGPSGTRMFETTLLRPAGPFWITDLSPLVVRDFDLLRTRYTHSTTEDTPPSQPREPEFASTTVSGEHWEAGSVETHLPYRDIVANDLDFRHFPWIMADREWVVGIMDLEAGTSVTVYHVG